MSWFTRRPDTKSYQRLSAGELKKAAVLSERSHVESVVEESGKLVVLVRTGSGVFAVQRVDGELEYLRLRDACEPCPLDQSAAIALLRMEG